MVNPLKNLESCFSRDIVITRYRERMVDSRIRITESEINDYIQTRLNVSNTNVKTSTDSANTNTPEMLYISQIVVPIKESDTRQDQNAAKAKADEIYKKLQNEKDFINFVNRMVAVDKTLKVQDLGYRTLDRLPQIFIDATAKLQPGQLAPTILKTSAGFHILKLLDRKGGKSAIQEEKTPELTLGQSIQIEQAEVRHILLTKKAGVNDVDIERKLKLYKSQVEAKTADFGELAKKFSEDKETAPNSGYLGWLSVGQSLPEFDVAIKNTKVGNVTEPFETTFGWHILQVTNKQSKEITFTQQKEYARNALRQERLEQSYSDWTRELRDNATVEYRPPFAAEN
jgi:peptidyl-prolyl cis-trans isomerase SurA